MTSNLNVPNYGIPTRPWWMGHTIAEDAGFSEITQNAFKHAYLSAVIAWRTGSIDAAYSVGEFIEFTDINATSSPNRRVDTFRDTLYDHVGILAAAGLLQHDGGYPFTKMDLQNLIIDFFAYEDLAYALGDADALRVLASNFPDSASFGFNPFYDYWDSYSLHTLDRFVSYIENKNLPIDTQYLRDVTNQLVLKAKGPPLSSSGDFIIKLFAPCFAAGTPILLGDGTSVAIEDVTAGMRVAAFDECDAAGTTELTSGLVTRLIPGITSEWIVLDDASSARLGQPTRVTPHHRYLRPDGTFTAIAEPRGASFGPGLLGAGGV